MLLLLKMKKRHKFYYKNYSIYIKKTFTRRIVARFARGYTENRLIHLRQFAIMKLMVAQPRYSFLHLFCLHTGRTRFILPMFKCSRIAFREDLAKGFGSGVFRHS